LHSTKWSDGRRNKDGNHSPLQKRIIEDSEGNEENRYPVLHSNKTKVNDAKEPNVYNNTSKKKSCK
jgi:hypothetical protein